jgi:hypothetical protein
MPRAASHSAQRRVSSLKISELLAAKENNFVHRAHFELSLSTPLYQYLLVNVDEYRMSGGQS